LRSKRERFWRRDEGLFFLVVELGGCAEFVGHDENKRRGEHESPGSGPTQRDITIVI